MRGDSGMKLDPLSSVIGSTLWRWRQKPKNIQVLLNFLISVEEAAVEVRVKELKCNSSQGLFLCPEKGEHPLDSGLSVPLFAHSHGTAVLFAE
ncbi:hypothetical protein NN561_010202 [Cricetulus griseus]